MQLEIRNNKFWEYVPTFVKKTVCLPTLGIVILGYFPYHTARIRPSGVYQTLLPRELFTELEKLLILNHINDNKSVYICTPLTTNTGAQAFAIMLKDDYVLIGTWYTVVNYDNTQLKINSNV